MKLTVPLLEATYDFISGTPPFRGWGMPPVEVSMVFRVGKTRNIQGQYVWCPRRDAHVITISGARVAHVGTLLAVMAHEMIHLYQNCRRTETDAEHNAEFRRLAKIVCRHHGYDPLEF